MARTADPPPGDDALVLLDTQVWIWAVTNVPERVAAHIPALVTRAATEDRLRISAVSVWEAAQAISRGRIPIRGTLDAWLDEGISGLRARVWPLDRHVALESVRLPGLKHKDPGDRFIIATARLRGALLVTTDREILAYGTAGHVRVLDAR